MSYILSIETTTTVCSVALHKDGVLLGHQELFVEKSHSSLLTILINDLMNYCGVPIGDLDAVAISEGPGSYTGLRIGASTAKGLCYSMEIPLIGVNTLEAMILSVKLLVGSIDMFCPMLDARRMEVYCLLSNGRAEIVDPVEARIINENSFSNLLKSRKIAFFGNGSMKCKEVITHSNAVFIDDITPNAKNIGVIASDKFNNGLFLDLAYFEPFYLKDFRPTQPKAV